MSTTQTRAPRRSPAQRRVLISAAARELAITEGLSALTLRAVAARAGVTPALVAHYVPTMDHLVATTFSEIVGAELDDLVSLVAAGTAVERLAVMLGSLLDGSRDDVTLVWVEAFALGRRNEPLAAAARDAMDDWQRALQTLLAEGVAAGDIHVEDPADAAWQLLGMIDGINAQSLVRWGGASDRSALLLRAVEGMLGIRRGTLDPRTSNKETP